MVGVEKYVTTKGTSLAEEMLKLGYEGAPTKIKTELSRIPKTDSLIEYKQSLKQNKIEKLQTVIFALKKCVKNTPMTDEMSKKIAGYIQEFELELLNITNPKPIQKNAIQHEVGHAPIPLNNLNGTIEKMYPSELLGLKPFDIMA